MQYIQILLNKFKKHIILGIVVGLILSYFAFYQPWKQDIHTANINDLMKIDQIGKERAEDILDYLREYPYCSVDDLKNVYDVGDTLVGKLKKEFK